jgi:methionyl-tRNA synthetase
MSDGPFPTDAPAVVTCGLPYANGALHIGHLRTYVGGDIMTRALRLLGQDVAFVSGSDMHGTPVAVNAAAEGVDPETFAMRYHEQYTETFPAFHVAFDQYGHTHDAMNTATTTEVVEALIEGGRVYDAEVPVAYDATADQWLPDRFVEGSCPYCGAHARGDECDEGCGRHLEPGEIEAPVSTVTGNPAEYRTRAHKFFAVSELQAELSRFLDALEGTTNAQRQPREWVEGELQDWCITRDIDWGIDFPGEEELVLYVWVDAPIEYIAATRQYTERVGPEVFDAERAWREDGQIIHVIGRDIIQHHAVFWPAMLMTAGFVTPRAIMASGFITLEGRGFSTSRGRAVWAEEYLETGFAPDLLRYYLATNGGFQQDVDFSWERFAERVNTELVGTLGNFAYRSMLFAHREFGAVPEATVDPAIEGAIEAATAAVEAAVNAYDVRAIGEAAMELARRGNEHIQQEEPWKLEEGDPRKAQVIAECLHLVKAACVCFAPIAPVTMQTLWEQLGEEGGVDSVPLEAAMAPPTGPLPEPAALFTQIEEETVAELTEALHARIAETAPAEAETPTAEPIMTDRIDFESFSELDIRTGEILAAEPVEGADKLVQLTVDIGVEQRQIVAGIRQLHAVEELPGTAVVILANLEPATLFGVESDGMLLAAGEDAALLTTHTPVPPGTRIR